MKNLKDYKKEEKADREFQKKFKVSGVGLAVTAFSHDMQLFIFL